MRPTFTPGADHRPWTKIDGTWTEDRREVHRRTTGLDDRRSTGRGPKIDGTRTEGRDPLTYQTWMRFFTPGAAHHRLGLVCLGVGLQYGALPTVGHRVLDQHVAVVISTG